VRSTVFASRVVVVLGLVSCGGGGRKDTTPVVRTSRAGDPVESYGDSSERPAPVTSHLLPLRQSPALRRTPVARAEPGPYEAELVLCISETNALRVSEGLPALTRSPELEACAAEAAAEDHRSGTPHGHFQRTSGCDVALAENELPRWLLAAQPGALAGVIRSGIAMMWDEGPGGGHHDNIVGPKYREIGCGVFIGADSVTVVQSFR